MGCSKSKDISASAKPVNQSSQDVERSRHNSLNNKEEKLRAPGAAGPSRFSTASAAPGQKGRSSFGTAQPRVVKSEGADEREAGNKSPLPSRNSLHASDRLSERSSFATDRDAEPQRGFGDAKGRLKPIQSQEPEVLMTGDGAFIPPAHLATEYVALGVLAPDMPTPISMLSLLWKKSAEETARLVDELQSLSIMRVATLEDGSLWSLTADEHLRNIQASHSDKLPALHGWLLDAYSQHGQVPLHEITDDGYIMQCLSHHLIGAGRWGDLRKILSEPSWLESKLHAYGMATVVQDFRRYLGEGDSNDTIARLLLQAIQLSHGCCAEHSNVKMLREQMLGRLVSVSESEAIRDWYTRHSKQAAAAAAEAVGKSLVHLLPMTASLQQAGGVHRMTLRGHSAPVKKVVISPNGQDVVTISLDGSAQVWDMNVGDCVMQLAREVPLVDVAIAPDGVRCCIASEDGHCCVWDLATGEIKHVFEGHTAKVNSVAIDRQGIHCVTASDDCTARVWNMASGECVQVLQGHGVAGPDGYSLGAVFDAAISYDGSLAATASEDFACRIWDLDSEQCTQVLEGHSGWVVSVNFIGNSGNVISASHDGSARVWDGDKGKCLHVLTGHTGRLNKVCVNAGGKFGVTCGDDNAARVWDLDSGACMAELTGHTAWVNDAAVTKDGSRAVTVSGDGLGRVWDLKSGALVYCLEGHNDNIRSMVMTNRGRFVITTSDDCTARVWDLQAALEVEDTVHHSRRVRKVRALPGGRLAVSASDDGQVVVWDSSTGAHQRTLECHKPGAIYMGVAEDGRRVMTGSSDRSMACWDVLDGRQLMVLPSQQGSRVKDIAFSGNGARAAIVLFDSSVSVWDLASGEVVAQLMGRGERVGRNVHTGGVNGVALSHDGGRAVTFSKDCTARVWSVADNAVTHVIRGHSDGVCYAALSPDEALLATSSYNATVYIHVLGTAAPLAILDHEATPALMAFSPDAVYLAVALENSQVVIWNLPANSCLPPLVGHKAQVMDMAFSPDSCMLATCSQDCTVRVWDCSTARQIAFIMTDNALSCTCFAGAPRPHALLAGDMAGVLHFLDLPPMLHPHPEAPAGPAAPR